MKLEEVMKKAAARAQEIAEGAKAANREMTPEEQTEFKAMSDKALLLKADVEEAKALKDQEDADAKVLEDMKALADYTESDEGKEAETDEAKSVDGSGKIPAVDLIKKTKTTERKTLGMAFTESKGYVDALKANPGGLSRDAARSIPQFASDVGVKELIDERKALITAPAVGESVRIENTGPNAFRLIDFARVVPTGRDAISVYQLTSTAAAAVTAEGVLKPEGSFTFTKRTLSPEVIAEWVPVTKQALADFNEMRALIDDELADNVLSAIEVEMAADLAATSGLQVQAFDTDAVVSIRRGVQTLNDINKFPNAILMNSTDAADLDLLKGSDGHYINGGPFGNASGRVWKLPIIPSPVLPQGFAYAGNAGGLVWQEREALSITTGWIDQQLVENEVTILAEARGVTNVRAPFAWAKIDIAA